MEKRRQLNPALTDQLIQLSSWLSPLPSDKWYQRYNEKGNGCPEKAASKEPHHQGNNACGQHEQEYFGNQYDYDKSNDQ